MRPMRRTDKEIISPEQLDAIIRGSQVCRLALIAEGRLYLVPLSFGYDGAALYFHTALEGRKIAAFLAGGEVCFECERNVEVRRGSADNACQWSMNYESVSGYGTISELTTAEEKRHAFDQIMRQYTARDWTFPDDALLKTRTWKLIITSMTGKISRPKAV
ncbi:MAG: pyridoxamine 5'-phosphate oxidase family protein [Kiritimatiellaeota bacterium]|nr:pyridoxamine 5'-phosphate oxidase family protein [Kiritimatiellota bacterium]